MTDSKELFECVDCGTQTDIDGGGENEQNEFRCIDCFDLHEKFEIDPTGLWMERKNIYRVENTQGLDVLNKLADALGYKPHGFRYGSSLEVMLADNQDLMEKLLAGINDLVDRNEEAAENLKQDL